MMAVVMLHMELQTIQKNPPASKIPETMAGH